MGRVFLLDGRMPKQVIKFQVGYARARDFMLRENDALNLLVKAGLPAAKIAAESNPRLFLVKDYIEGPTLQGMPNTWTKFPEDEQLLMFRALAKFMTQVEKSGFKIGDLKAANVMFDPAAKKWIIMDPSSAAPNKGPQTLWLIEQALANMSRASHMVRLAREQPEWLEKEIRLRRSFQDATRNGSVEAMQEYLCQYEKISTNGLSKAPADFQALWTESLSEFKYSLPRNNGYPLLKGQYVDLLESTLKVMKDKSNVAQVASLLKSAREGACLGRYLTGLEK